MYITRISGAWLANKICPGLYVPAVTDIDLIALRDQGIRALLVDLDNTIANLGGSEVRVPIAEWIQRAKDLDIFVCIVTNAAFSARVAEIAKRLDVAFLTKAVKPRRVGLRYVMDNLGLVPSQMVMIGDQLFTDVLSGNRLGALTILVDPLTSTRFITGQFLRLFERPLLAWLKREGMFPSRLGSGS